MRRFLLGLGLFAAPALGQSLNIDLNTTSGAGNGAPSSTFGAAAQQTGVWNAVTISSSGSVSLVGLDGANSGCTLTRGGSGVVAANSSIAGATADFGKLVWDYQRAYTPNHYGEATINGLDPGVYKVYVYACIAGADGAYDSGGFTSYHRSLVALSLGGQNIGSGFVGGLVEANKFAKGVTHAEYTIVVGDGAPPLQIRSYVDLANGIGRAALNGIQLVKYPADRLYVDWTRTGGAKDGRDWTNAFTSLQDALGLARTSAAGAFSEIWVADGTYLPVNGSDRTQSFELISNVRVYGGFAGDETSIAQRDIATNRTILSGALPVLAWPPGSQNSYHVVYVPQDTFGAVLDGFTIQSGNANGIFSLNDGGGAYISSGSFVRFENCLFRWNHADWEGGAAYSIWSWPFFVNCDFYSNNSGGSTADGSDGGGGAFKQVGQTGGFFPPTPVFVNCRFLGNSTDGHGGAAHVVGGDAYFFNCLLAGNLAQGHGGGIYVDGNGADGADLEIRNCTIASNRAERRGGGLYAADYGQMDVKNCIVWGNTAADNVGCPGLCEQGYYNEFGTIIRYSYTTLQGHNATVFGPGNNGFDPEFRDPFGADGISGNFDDDYTLLGWSPAIDAANESMLPTDQGDFDQDGNSAEQIPLDLAGRPRRIDQPGVPDTGVGAAPQADRGAYEYANSLGDMNCDGLVNFDDIDGFVTALVGEAAYEAQFPDCWFDNGDANGDGSVNFDDIDAFVTCLILGGCP